ncbi:methyltransferase (TIGR00027 family) [Kibdelosporangium banguiense]|uniref:S-adenosyl-L-methionine-dependent methyltransferase n=1 Tax=Kibdelosporangium banguiense TaxID=1365924 RepID=A0ABS4TMW7_9PSEU|nr:SAM-dependent methyltransferase [Kibdelosporangium banguiense]MBP2325241.1 methyltransferase (TIGR00027 family) [Kibdelosporangium banguiense]
MESSADRVQAANAAFMAHTAIQARFYDDYLLAASTAGCLQIVLLAAGLDTRAFRLDWPDEVRLYELDSPQLLAYKEKILSASAAVARGGRTVLDVDLRSDWPARLIDAGFEPSGRTAWLVQGVLMYLSETEAGRLFTSIGRLSAAGSRLACEQTGGRAGDREDPVEQLWKGGLGSRTVDWLSRHGWDVQLYRGTELASAYELAPPPAVSFVIATMT